MYHPYITDEKTIIQGDGVKLIPLFYDFLLYKTIKRV